MKANFDIESLYGSAYQNAIENVIKVLSEHFGTFYVFSYREDWEEVHKISKQLKIKFDENGEII